MPQYMLLIYVDPDAGPEAGTPEADARMAEWMTYSQEMAQTGVMQAGDALHPGSTATTVRVRGGERLITDGPFAETKEFLGGYYLIDAPDLDVALDWAARAPHIADGSVEIRPTMNFAAQG